MKKKAFSICALSILICGLLTNCGSSNQNSNNNIESSMAEIISYDESLESNVEEPNPSESVIEESSVETSESEKSAESDTEGESIVIVDDPQMIIGEWIETERISDGTSTQPDSPSHLSIYEDETITLLEFDGVCTIKEDRVILEGGNGTNISFEYYCEYDASEQKLYLKPVDPEKNVVLIFEKRVSSGGIVTREVNVGDIQLAQKVYNKSMVILDLMNDFELGNKSKWLDMIDGKSDLDNAIEDYKDSGADSTIIMKANDISNYADSWTQAVNMYNAGKLGKSSITKIKDNTEKTIDEFVEMVNG